VLFVDIFISVPLPRQKRVLLADDLSIEECCQERILLRQSFDSKIATKIRILFVYVLKRSKEDRIINMGVMGLCIFLSLAYKIEIPKNDYH
jgi:hypothetical protein